MRHCVPYLALLALVLPVSGQEHGQAGVFDYYILSLSWSPEFCYSHAGSPECSAGHHLGFVVHGLWPESRYGGGPEYCAHTPGPKDPGKMLDIMPDLGLIQHEWEAHGACSGMGADQYFAVVRRAFQFVHVPSEFTSRGGPWRINQLDIKKAFEQSNPNLHDGNIAVECRGPYLQGIEICLSKDLQPVPCQAIHSCAAKMIRVTPIH